MLVVTRRERDEVIITIGEKTVILTICAVVGSRVKLGFTADREIGIYRRELMTRKEGTDGDSISNLASEKPPE